MIAKDPSFIYVTYIAARPENVWKALTDGEVTKQYFFGRRFEGEVRKGARWRLVMENGETDTDGEILECDPPHKLTLSWQVQWLEEMRGLPPARVEYLIEPVGNGSRLTVKQYNDENIPPQYVEGGRQGWPMVLSGLKTLLETGKALQLPAPEPPK
jgi:uncharacterized protein YndB with AHSA1/START domain